MTPELAKAFGLDQAKGSLVTGVMPGTPAEKAGLQKGDVILRSTETQSRIVTDYVI